MNQISRKVSRTPSLTPQVVIVDGQHGCGKTMLSTIVAALDRVELLTYAYEVEYACALQFLNKMDLDAAVVLVRMFTDLKLYNVMMSREVNFRPKDLSSIFHNPHPIRYIKRLFEEGDRQIPRKIEQDNPILHLTTHNLLSFSEPVFKGLRDRVTLIELVRHPLYMIKQQAQNMERLLNNVRYFTVNYQYNETELPYYVRHFEDEFIKANNVEKAILCMHELFKLSEQNKTRLKENYGAKIITVPFERYVLDPDGYMDQITTALGTSVTSLTHRVMKKQKVPRAMYADGVDRKVYRRYEWKPPETASEESEFAMRRNFAKEKASDEAMAILDQTCAEYEEKYLS